MTMTEEDLWGDSSPVETPQPPPPSPPKKGRHPDYIKTFNFGKYKMTIAIWIHSDSATLVVSSFENGRWYVKLKEELKKWGSSK